MARKYTKEFKEEAVKLVVERGYSQAEAGRVLGVDSKNISHWIKGLAAEKSVGKQISPDQEEIKRLRKENERLVMEREILKKAAAFFANEKR
jgi:transposase